MTGTCLSFIFFNLNTLGSERQWRPQALEKWLWHEKKTKTVLNTRYANILSRTKDTHSLSHTLAGSQGWRKERRHPLHFNSSRWCFLGKTIRDVASFPAGSNWCPACKNNNIYIFVFHIHGHILPRNKTKTKRENRVSPQVGEFHEHLSSRMQAGMWLDGSFFFFFKFIFLSCLWLYTDKYKTLNDSRSSFIWLTWIVWLKLEMEKVELCISIDQMTEDTTGEMSQNDSLVILW